MWLQADQRVLDSVDWGSELVVHRGKHDLGVIRHHLLALQVFLGGHVGEHEHNAPLVVPVVQLDLHVVAYSLLELPRLVVLVVGIFIGQGRHARVRVKQDGLFCSD